MVNARLCETATLAFFFASPRHFEFLDCETETLKYFECKRETLRLKIRAPDLVANYMYENELAQRSYKGAFCCNPLYETSDLKICQQPKISNIFLAMT